MSKVYVKNSKYGQSLSCHKSSEKPINN